MAGGTSASGRALLATAASDPGRLWGIAALGISPARTGEFVLDLDDRRDPLVAVAWSGRPHHFRPGPRQPETPLESVPFYAVPLRPDASAAARPAPVRKRRARRRRRHAVVCRDPRREVPDLRLRNVTADPGLDRERHLLYSIINSVTDPILLTDESGKLIIGNLRAEQLFASAPKRARAGGGRSRSTTCSSRRRSRAGWSNSRLATAREVVLVDPEDGSDLLFELLTSRLSLDRDSAPWCRCCAT